MPGRTYAITGPFSAEMSAGRSTPICWPMTDSCSCVAAGRAFAAPPPLSASATIDPAGILPASGLLFDNPLVLADLLCTSSLNAPSFDVRAPANHFAVGREPSVADGRLLFAARSTASSAAGDA